MHTETTAFLVELHGDVYRAKILHDARCIFVLALHPLFARAQLHRRFHPLTLETTSFPTAKERVPGVMKARAVGGVAEYTVNPSTTLTYEDGDMFVRAYWVCFSLIYPRSIDDGGEFALLSVPCSA